MKLAMPCARWVAPLALWSIALGLAVPTAAQSPDQAIGATERGCASAYAVGYTQCAQHVPRAAAPAAPSKPAASKPADIGRRSGGVTEADVDAYLANHGKPSREAARALLDPSDENIAAMARRLRQDAAVAAYVAGRMTSLQEIDPGLTAVNPLFNSQDLPWLAGMRVVLHVSLGCRSCEAAAMVLQRLVAESPVLDARVVVHGARDAGTLTLELARMGITLPATTATAAAAPMARLVPVAVVADTRLGKEGVTTEFSNSQALRVAISNFRRQAPVPAQPPRGLP